MSIDTYGYTRIVCDTFYGASSTVLDRNPYTAEEYFGREDFIVGTFYCTWGILLLFPVHLIHEP